MSFKPVNTIPVRVTISNAARQLGVSVPTVHRWISSGLNNEILKPSRVGLKWRIPQECIDKLLSGECQIVLKAAE